MKTILYIDDDHEQIDLMRDLFSEETLKKFFTLNLIHCPHDGTDREKHKNSILTSISSASPFDVIIFDMLLRGGNEQIPYLSLEIANEIKSELPDNIEILFVTNYTNKNEKLTGDPNVWDSKRFLHRNKPKIKNNPFMARGFCPPSQNKICCKKNTGSCTEEECFIQFMMLLHNGKISHKVIS